MSSTITSSLLNLQSHLQCDICHNLLNEPHTITECGHSFCRGCVYDKVGIERKCPTCQEPALIKNLRPAPMYDTLVGCVRKLGTMLVGGTPTVDSHALLFSSISSTTSTTAGANRQSLTCQRNTEEELLPINGNNQQKQHSNVSSSSASMRRLLARTPNNKNISGSKLETGRGSINDNNDRSAPESSSSLGGTRLPLETMEHQTEKQISLLSRQPMSEKDTNVHTTIPSIYLGHKIKQPSNDMTAAAMTHQFSISNQQQHDKIEENEQQEETSMSMQLTQQEQQQLTSLSTSLSDEINLPSWMDDMFDRSSVVSNDNHDHLVFDTPFLQDHSNISNNETPERTPEMLRDWFLSRTNSDQSRMSNNSLPRVVLSPVAPTTAGMNNNHDDRENGENPSPLQLETQEKVTSPIHMEDNLNSITNTKNDLSERQLYPYNHHHDDKTQIASSKYNPSSHHNVNNVIITSPPPQKQQHESSLLHKHSSTMEQLEISKSLQPNKNDNDVDDKDNNNNNSSREALLADLLHGTLPDDEQPLSKRRKTTPSRIQSVTEEKILDQALYECLAQEDGLPDDELPSSFKKRQKGSQKKEDITITKTRKENNSAELTTEDLFSLLNTSALPDDEMPISRKKQKGHQEQQQTNKKIFVNEKCYLKIRDQSKKHIQDQRRQQEKRKTIDIVEATSIDDDDDTDMVLTMQSSKVNDMNEDDVNADDDDEDMIMTLPINSTTTHCNNDDDSYDEDMIETLPMNVIATDNNDSDNNNDIDEDRVSTIPIHNVSTSNDNDCDDNVNDNDNMVLTLDDPIEKSNMYVTPTKTKGLDIFDIDTPFPHSKRLKRSKSIKNTNSSYSIPSSPLIRTTTDLATTKPVSSTNQPQDGEKEGMAIEREYWECMHCFFKNTQSLEKCKFCQNLRDTAPEHTVQQSIMPSSTFLDNDDDDGMLYSLMNNSVIPSSQLEQDQLADTGGSLLYYNEEEKEEEQQIPKKSVQVMFTGIEVEKAETLFAQLMETGLTMQVNNTDADDIPRYLEEGVTHIITRKQNDENLCKRTLKYLWGILAGVWIVDVSWLDACINKKQWVSEESYEIAGDTATGLTFAPRKGRLRRNDQDHNIKWNDNESLLLFHGIVFYFFDKKHPQREKLVRLCVLAGGDVKHRRPPVNETGAWCDNHDIQRREINPNHPIIIVTDEKQLKNKKNAKTLELYQVRDSHWLLDCISRNEVLTQ